MSFILIDHWRVGAIYILYIDIRHSESKNHTAYNFMIWQTGDYLSKSYGQLHIQTLKNSHIVLVYFPVPPYSKEVWHNKIDANLEIKYIRTKILIL